MTETKRIQTVSRHDGRVEQIVLASPGGNVLDRQMMEEISEAVRAAARRPELRALILQAEGKHFSFGASVQEHRKAEAASMLTTFSELFHTLVEASVPLCAVVRGACLGGALELVSFCHFVFADESATFGQPEITLGVFPPVACLLLPLRIGQGRADDLVLTGRSVSAKEAKDIGLVHEVSPAPEEACDAFVREYLVGKSARSLRIACRASRHDLLRDFRSRLTELERLYVEELMETQDANEGIQAFLDKRNPVWQDR
jgi:cyclohexa-1,5-dienecarbonyl-CoA hydratase